MSCLTLGLVIVWSPGTERYEPIFRFLFGGNVVSNKDSFNALQA